MSDGSQSNLLNLVGTIPVISHQNQGRVIEVPLEICLPYLYPTDVPLIWVRPALLSPEQRALMGNLVVRQTDSVDGNGMVWGLEGFRNLRLVELISHLQNLFKYQLPIVSSVVAVSGSVGNVAHNDNSPELYDSPRINNQETPTISTSTSKQQSQSNSENSISNSDLLKSKVENEIEKLVNKSNEEMEEVLKAISSLEEGESILNREKMTLNNEINLLNKEIANLESKRTDMERLFATKMESNATSIMRSASVPSDPASSQLLELISNESALMDVLYSVIKVTITPTGGEKINLTMALRCIRELSRKHFLTKVHIRKIVEK